MKFAEWLERLLELRDEPLPSHAGVVIAIGTDLSRDGNFCSPQSYAIARKTFEIFHGGIANSIILCGGYSNNGTTTEAAAMSMVISQLSKQVTGMNGLCDHIFLETESYRTFMNADMALPIMREKGWRSAIIVAQQWHARRVKATFKKRWQGSDIRFTVVKAQSRYTYDNSQWRLRSFWRFVIWDTLAFVVSKIKGYC